MDTADLRFRQLATASIFAEEGLKAFLGRRASEGRVSVADDVELLILGGRHVVIIETSNDQLRSKSAPGTLRCGEAGLLRIRLLVCCGSTKLGEDGQVVPDAWDQQCDVLQLEGVIRRDDLIRGGAVADAGRGVPRA